MRPQDFERANTLSIAALEAAVSLAEAHLARLAQPDTDERRQGVVETSWYAALTAAADARNTLEAARWLVRKGKRTVDGLERAG